MIKSKHLRKTDLLFITIAAFLWSLLAYVLTFYFPQIFELILFTIAVFATFLALFIRKLGSITLFFLIAGIMTLAIPAFLVSGIEKIVVFIIMGVIFEAITYTLKNYLNIIVASIFSNVSMPWQVSWLTKMQLTTKINYAIWNLTFISALLGLLGATSGLIIWYKVKNSKIILRFKYEG